MNAEFIETSFPKIFEKKKEKKKVISHVEVFKKSCFLEKIQPEPIYDCEFPILD